MKNLNYIKNVINNRLGNIVIPQYDDKAITEISQSIPNSIDITIRCQIKDVINEILQVYSVANSKEVTIGVIGDFSVGKSSFINAILGEKFVPVSSSPSTAIITKIKYGQHPKAIIHYDDNRNVEMTYDEFMEFSSFHLDDFRERDKTGEIKRFRDIVDATLYVKSDFLKKNNLCIIDTLGLSSHESDNKRTIASLKNAIALIYVCLERGLSSKDTDFISSYLSVDREDLFFCINRIDLVKKSERENVKDSVKLKLDDMINKMGSNKQFPANRIYYVSSLYQDFANGHIVHEEFCKGKDYQSLSGFLPLMNDICKYVEENVDDARKRAINNQLIKASAQILTIKSFRESEMRTLTNSIKCEIKTIETNIKRVEDRVAYIKSLFDNLEQKIYSLQPGLYMAFLDEVDKHWQYTVKFDLIDKVSFGFGDYLKLEKDIMALKINVFKSMSDSRYSTLESLSPFVNLTFLYLEKAFTLIQNRIHLQISEFIREFTTSYSYLNAYFEKHEKDFCSTALSSHVIDNSPIKCAMYRAAAEASIENTWIKNSNRIMKMFNAAKCEAIRTMERPCETIMENLICRTLEILNTVFDDSVESDMFIITNLKYNKKNKELQLSKLIQQWNREISYYVNINNVIIDSQIDNK